MADPSRPGVDAHGRLFHGTQIVELVVIFCAVSYVRFEQLKGCWSVLLKGAILNLVRILLQLAGFWDFERVERRAHSSRSFWTERLAARERALLKQS